MPVLGQMVIVAPLLEMLKLGNADARTRATTALWRMVHENPEQQREIAAAGFVNPADLVHLLREGVPAAKEFALWSISLATDETNQRTIMEEGGIRPLVAALMAPAVEQREHAAAALARLATGCSETQLAIAREGGVAPLIALLDAGMGSPSTQVKAARCLALMAEQSENKDAIVAAAAVSQLVSPIDGRLRKRLIGEIDREIGGEKSRHMASDAHCLRTRGRRRRLTRWWRSTLTKLLITCLDGLAECVTDCPVHQVALLSDGETEAKQCAAAALARLAHNDAQTQLAIGVAGAIAPLVNLLRGDRGETAQEEAAGALFELGAQAVNRLAITESGGIGPLVVLLGCSNAKARGHAIGALSRLSIENANRVLIIKQLVSMLSDQGAGAQEQAAAALANLARDSADNRVSIVDAGGIAPLLALLDSDSSTAKENSVRASDGL